MKKGYPSTFNDWVIYESSVAVTIPVEEYRDYQSEYMFMFNYIRDKGWKRKNRRWYSPNYPKLSYTKLIEAYQSQKLWEMQHEE